MQYGSTCVDVMAEQLGLGTLDDYKDDGRLLEDSDVSELEQFARAFKEENGLIPNVAVPSLLRCSRQNWHQLRGNYNFKTWHIYGKDWYSRSQIEEFYKLRRADGVQGPGRISLKELWNDAQTD